MINVIRLICGLFVGYTSGAVMTIIIGSNAAWYMHGAWLLLAGGAGLLINPAMQDVVAWWHDRKPVPVHPGTGRPFGDHGSGTDVMEYALYHMDDADDKMIFIYDIFHGVWHVDHKPYYDWLREQGR